MRRVQRVGVISLGKVLGTLYGLFGLIAGVFIALMSFLGAGFDPDVGFLSGVFGGFAALIVLPLFYGVAGFVGGLITAAFYNLVAGWTGGIEVELR